MVATNIERARTAGQVLVGRIQTDEAFAAQLKSDPVAALVVVGLSETAFPDPFLESVNDTGDIDCIITCIGSK